ncbi:hypothetical protein M0812_20465 [Anaeramoeba flamelloides]|uniref:START domain-containing protein n=1 Tax=Anaeramoeba flamelloides TaxID=1746091 RepID=A0AAV7YV21_9EUKA|nr:hypothetical protein M0812_20465 [Anaeramoeba flamelloides]
MTEKQRKLCLKLAEEAYEVVVNDLITDTSKWQKDKRVNNIFLSHYSPKNNKFNKLRFENYYWGVRPSEIFNIITTLKGRQPWDTQSDDVRRLIEFDPPEGANNLYVVYNHAKKILGGLVSQRYGHGCFISKKLKDGTLISAQQSIKDVTKVGVKKQKFSGQQTTTYPSGFILKPMTRKEWNKLLKTEDGKQMTPDPLWKLEGDPDEIVGLKYDALIQLDIGGWFAAWQINKFAARAFAQSLTELDNFIRGGYRKIQKRRRMKRKKRKEQEKKQKKKENEKEDEKENEKEKENENEKKEKKEKEKEN